MQVLMIRQMQANHETQYVSDTLLRRMDNTTYTIHTIGHGGDDVLVPAAIIRLRRTNVSYDLIHAFGGKALTVALLCTKAPILFSPVQFPDSHMIAWLRAILSYRTVHVVCDTEAMRRKLITRGISSNHCHVIRPGVSMGDIKRNRNHALRKQLEFDSDSIVLFVPFELTHQSGHANALWACSLLNVLDKKYRILLWGKGTQIESTRNLQQRLLDPDMLSIATEKLGNDTKLEQLFAAADVIVLSNIDPVPTLPIAMSMAAGLPIIASTTPTTAELIEDRHTALLVKSPTPRSLAQRIHDLISDPQLQWQISDRARAEAYDHFSQTSMLEYYAKTYKLLAHFGQTATLLD